MTSIQKIFIQNGVLVAASSDADYSWHHYDLRDDGAIKALNNDSSVPEFARTALTAQSSRPRVDIENDSLLIILRGANLNDDSSEHDMISIRILAEENRLITAQFRTLKTTNEFLHRAQNGKPEKSVSALLAKIISVLFERIEETVMSLSDLVDQLEETVDEGSATTREKISSLRRKVVVFKRHLSPQREVASRLRFSEVDWIEGRHTNLHNENYERIMRNIEELEEMRDKLSIIKEEVQTIQSEKLNRNTYVLSVVAAIFLPLGFLTGLLGINIAGMPGADYPPAFWIFCGFLFVVVGLQILWMRKNKWF